MVWAPADTWAAAPCGGCRRRVESGHGNGRLGRAEAGGHRRSRGVASRGRCADGGAAAAATVWLAPAVLPATMAAATGTLPPVDASSPWIALPRLLTASRANRVAMASVPLSCMRSRDTSLHHSFQVEEIRSWCASTSPAGCGPGWTRRPADPPAGGGHLDGFEAIAGGLGTT
jgi:hypothetical protein